MEINSQIVPQFPLKTASKTNQAYRADYFALSECGENAFLVEIKTDMGSRDKKQDKYLKKALCKGMDCLLSELKEITKVKNKSNRKKYFHLLYALSEIGLIKLPSGLKKTMYAEVSRGVFDLIEEIRICKSPDLQVVYIQPSHSSGSNDARIQCISFEFFASSIEVQGELGKRLAQYMRRWQTDAGQCPPACE